MKILAIRLENLASLAGNHELDFTQPPLADAGLFAITGPTGAGKSTLLDALCLGLYGNTPRLRGARQDQARLPDVGDSDVTSFDPRTLLRRGAAGGHAEVDFLGRDGHRYRARWAVRRARDKAEGRLQAAEQSLTNLEDGRLLTAQKREFDRLLPEVLGLSFEQFTRAVLLAQSEFSAFLKADDNDRSDLLERLTGTTEYSAISMAAYRRAKEAKGVVDALLARLNDDLPAAPDVRAELERDSETTQQALTHLQRQAESLKAQQRWHSDDAHLKAAHVEGLDQQQVADTHWQALAEQRADRHWRRLMAPRRQDLSRQARLPGLIAEAEHARHTTRQALARAQQEAQDASGIHRQAALALEAANEARRKAEPDLNQAREQHHALNQRRRELAELTAECERAREQAARYREQHRQEHERQQQRLEQQRQWQATPAELMGSHTYQPAARQAIQQAHDSAASRQLALGELQGVWREYHEAERAHRQRETRLAEAHERLEALTREGQAARQRLEERKSRHDNLSAFIERARAARSDSVVMLREGLQEGEPCSVCGGRDHPWRQHPPATPEAAQLAAQQAAEEHELDDARQKCEQALNAHQELQAQYKVVRDTLQQHQNEQPAGQARLQAARQALDAHPLTEELTPVAADERDAWLSRQRQSSSNERNTHQATLERLHRAEAELAPLEESLRQGELALTRLTTEKTNAEARLAELDARRPALQRQHDETAAALRTLLGDYATPEAWQQRLDHTETQARQALDAALSRQHAAERELQRLSQRLDHQEQQLGTLQQESDQLVRSLSEWRQAHPELDDATLARLLAQPQEEAERDEARLQAADEASQRAAATLAERRSALLRHRRAQGLADDENDDELLGEACEARIARRHDDLAAEREALEPGLQEAQRRRDDAVHALRDDERRRARQQAGQAELEAARTEHHRWGRISELIGSADGKAFRRIAQAYNLELLLDHANAHLANLAPRYRMARGGSPLGMLVIDHDMGDEQRSAHSLSGGETFLVSLALALGLASMASGNLVIESLFIDEGFGSLDPQSLALAMDALDGLQAQGRRVGVISHIQEMHERIPVQIKVEPLGNGASRARLVSA
ncbi:AAA family ATPase [Halomonas chromatireducens]|uniref:Nuclease SbcCD subunit C n=1 Tax=Halomonas chromatireducens TaxID=507626 RepID=A0A0X8HF39_9GAMM|nr:AAA family ATPase [Halomonas chromatireducens]AMD01470.1 Nuclease SbcCD subunit C [Halomonas chromatireducens]